MEPHQRPTYVQPLGAIETALANIWSEVLSLPNIGRDDVFVRLGGDTSSAARTIDNVKRALGVRLPVSALLNGGSLAEISRKIREMRRHANTRIFPAARTALVPASLAQQQLWFLSQTLGASEAYHVPLNYRLQGKLNEEALSQALNRLLQRHEALRTRFETIDGEVFQRIDSPAIEFSLRRQNLSADSNAERRLKELLLEEVRTPFDLENGPLIRGRLIRMSDRCHALLITLHHVISDGWSIRILVRELSVLYESLVHGETGSLAPLPIQYADYSIWQRGWLSGEVFAEHSAFWGETLAGAPALLRLPTDRNRPRQQVFSGDCVALNLDEELTSALRSLSERNGATLFITILTGWAVVLSRLSGQEDVVIGAPTANRTRAEVQGLIGLFVNTLALRIDVSGDPTLRQLLERVRTVVLDAQEHEELPFEEVVRSVKPVRSIEHTPLYQVMFDWKIDKEICVEFRGIGVSPISMDDRVAKLDMTLSIGQTKNRISGVLNYSSSLFDARTVQRHVELLRRVLRLMVLDESQRVSTLDLLFPEDWQQILRWNRTTFPYAKERCIHEVFEDQVLRQPLETAVFCDGYSLTYGALNAEANRLAHYLRSLGIGPDERVAICMERSIDMLIAVLGILKAGGAYVPLDPTYPAERLTYMLSDSDPVVTLTHKLARSVLRAAARDLKGIPNVIDLDADSTWRQWSAENPRADVVGLQSRHLAYVIYTSGSTGMPKGVTITHGNVLNLWCGLEEKVYRKHDVRRVGINASFTFDASVQQWSQLLSGRALYIVSESARRDMEQLLSFVDEHEIECLDCTPSQLSVLIAAKSWVRRHPLQVMLVGGEPIGIDLWETMVRSCDLTFYNVYGPTECTVDVTVGSVSSLPRGPTIGHPICNTRIYVMDRGGRPVPIGVVGEICIAGDGVGRGYLKRPELTEERFLCDTFCPEPDSRLYKTGDLGRYREDGNIEFLGRNDHQVKIRGYRIELGEIESQLVTHPNVREAVVVMREDQPGQKRLVGYYVVEGDGKLLVESLRAHLKLRLPDYMVPAALIRLQAFPLTPNNKLDRKALPVPDSEAFTTNVYELPKGPIEKMLASLWEQLLAVSPIGRHDNFFDLGGDSLLAMRLVNGVREVLDLAISVTEIFSHQSISSLASVIDTGKQHHAVGGPPPPIAPRIRPRA